MVLQESSRLLALPGEIRNLIYEYLLEDVRRAQRNVIFAESSSRGKTSLSYIYNRHTFKPSNSYLKQICHLIRAELSPLLHSLNNLDTSREWEGFELADLGCIDEFFNYALLHDWNDPHDACGDVVITLDDHVSRGVFIEEFLLYYSKPSQVTVLFPSYHPPNTVRYVGKAMPGCDGVRYEYERCEEKDSGLGDWLEDIRYSEDSRWRDYLLHRVRWVEAVTEPCSNSQCDWRWICRLDVDVELGFHESWMADIAHRKAYDDGWYTHEILRWRKNLGIPEKVPIFPFVTREEAPWGLDECPDCLDMSR